MHVDLWGYIVVDWSLTPKAKRRQVVSVVQGEAVQLSYLGLPNVGGYCQLVDGDVFVIGQSGVMYTLDEFQLAAGVSFGDYIARSSHLLAEAVSRAHAIASRKLTTYRITYSTKANPFDMAAQNIVAVDSTSAVDYANAYFPVEGRTVVSVEPVDGI